MNRHGSTRPEQILCANCAREVTASQSERVRRAYAYSFFDDPPFCTVGCAEIWHASVPDVCDTVNYEDEG